MNSPHSLLLITILLSSFISFNVFSAEVYFPEIGMRHWKKVIIPGATCGSGHPYVVWYEKRDPKKLAVEFMGGGACWSKQSCFGGKLRAWMFPLPQLPIMSRVSIAHPDSSPFWDNSMIYFPYCTGDVHAGTHIAKYGSKKAYHTGHKNIELALKFLNEENIIDFKRVEQLSLTGSSAGAIGALAHTMTFDNYVPERAERVLIADAPGLHFGKNFWKKFSNQMFQDFQETFAPLQLSLNKQETLLAKQIPTLCNTLKYWKIGILQGSKDIIMSVVFGDISREEHEALVYGPNGAYELTQKTANCATWTPSSSQHTFLVFKNPFEAKAQNVSAMEFVRSVISGQTGISYK